MYKEFGIKNLVSSKKMVDDAMKGHYAIPQFNINNLEWTRTILEVSEAQKSPVILGVSEGVIKYFGGARTITGLISNMLRDLKITIPVSIHLDHGATFESAKDALHAGFTSIMIDGSKHPLEENIALTKKVIEICEPYGVSVEGEVGQVAGEEDGVVGGEAAMYADPHECKKFAEETNVDMLAATLGSVHGHYKGEPKLGFEQMKFIANETKKPLVLHGGSGIPDEDIKKAIASGEAKINVNTECQDAFAKALRQYFEQGMDKQGKGYDPRKIIAYGMESVKKVLIHKIQLFGSNNKA